MGCKIYRCRRKIKKATSKYSPCEERPLKWTARVCKMKIPQLWYSHISKIWCLASIQLDFTAENIPASQSADYELYNWNRLKPRHQSVQSLWNLYCHQKNKQKVQISDNVLMPKKLRVGLLLYIIKTHTTFIMLKPDLYNLTTLLYHNFYPYFIPTF